MPCVLNTWRLPSPEGNQPLQLESNEERRSGKAVLFGITGETRMKVFRTAALLTALTLGLLLTGAALGGRNGMTIALVFAIFGNAIAYFFSDKIALMSAGARPV